MVPHVTENVAELDPCGTVTEAGTVAADVFELERETRAPPELAGAVRVTVPTPTCPLTMVLGLTETLLSAAVEDGVTVRANVVLTPAYDAVNVTGVDAFTLPAVTENVEEVDPCGTVTEAGTEAAVVFELETETTAPPEPAGAVIVIVPTPAWPLTMVLGLTETLLSAAAGGLIVIAKLLLTPE